MSLLLPTQLHLWNFPLPSFYQSSYITKTELDLYIKRTEQEVLRVSGCSKTWQLKGISFITNQLGKFLPHPVKANNILLLQRLW